MTSLDLVNSRIFQSESPNSFTEEKEASSNKNFCPVANPTKSTDNPLNTNNEVISGFASQSHDTDILNPDPQVDGEAKKLLAEIKGEIENLGNKKNNFGLQSVASGLSTVPSKAVSTDGKFPLSPIAQSIKEAFTKFFGNDGNHPARIFFSIITAVSAGMRSVFPVVKEALMELKGHDAFALCAIVLAACHVIISVIWTAIATFNFPSAPAGINGMSERENKLDSLGNAFTLFLEQISAKVHAFAGQGLLGALGAIREWLMLSSAVVSFLNALPVLIATIAPIMSLPIAAIVGGSINLVASILELLQGIKEFASLGEELQCLRRDLNNIDGSSPAAKAKLLAEIKNKENEQTASKVRIVKALIGIATSVASIVLGVLAIAASISVPGLPVILTSISMCCLLVYLVVAIAVRLNRLQKVSEASALVQSEDSGDTTFTSSDEEDESDHFGEVKKRNEIGPGNLQMNFVRSNNDCLT